MIASAGKTVRRLAAVVLVPLSAAWWLPATPASAQFAGAGGGTGLSISAISPNASQLL